MDNKNIEDIKAEDLIGTHDHLKKYLSKLDSQNPQHRHLAISAMEIYTKKYISSVMHLPDKTIDGVVGKQIEGLGFDALFSYNRHNLIRPDDNEIDEVLEGLAGRKATPQLRDDFWATWLAREAEFCIMGICNFMEKPLTNSEIKQIPANTLKQEIQQIEQIYKIPMTGIKSWIELLIEKEQKALAEWYKETETT